MKIKKIEYSNIENIFFNTCGCNRRNTSCVCYCIDCKLYEYSVARHSFSIYRGYLQTALFFNILENYGILI